MKKRKSLLILPLLFGSMIVSCGGSDTSKPTPTPPVTEDENKPNKPEDTKPDTPKEDWTIKTTCDAGSFEKESYKFSVVKDPNSYFEFDDPSMKINIDTSDWAYVTSYYEDQVKILSENETTLPASAITLNKVTGSSDNIIKGFELKIDRTKAKVGTTKIKVFIKPSNGSNSASSVTLCVPLEFVEHGSMDPEQVKVNFKIDLTGLDEAVIQKGLFFYVQDEDHQYDFSYKAVTDFKLSTLVTEVKDVLIPLNHRILFGARNNNDKGRFDYHKVEIKSDSSFEMDKDNYCVFTKAPTTSIEINLIK